MQTYTSSIPDLAYDPTETLAAFQARQHRAYEVGRQAWQQRRIKVQMLHLYEALVRCVGANRYTWVGEARLAEEFGVDVATIKRWIAKLVQAGLIRRQRRFATTSLTFITAYDPPSTAPEHAVSEQPISEAEQSAAQSEVQAAQDQAGSFAPESAPTFGAKMRRLNLKTDHLSSGGGTSSCASAKTPDPEITQILEQEGVTDFFLAGRLSQKSTDELRAVSAYLNRQRNVEDRAKLFAWLVSRDFGAQLLSGKHQHQRRRKPRPAQDHDSQKYLSGELAYLIQGGSGAPAGPQSTPPDDPAPSVTAQAAPPDATLTQTWQQVLEHIRQAVPAQEFQTWFSDAALVDLTSERAVVGVSNIFARDTLTQCYQAQIAQALHASCGRSVPVQIELGG